MGRPYRTAPFRDLRGTAVTRLALAGCTEAEIAVYTGLSLSGVREILEKSTTSAAIRPSPTAQAPSSPQRDPTGQTGLSRRTGKAE
jgi:hypothetical protein